MKNLSHKRVFDSICKMYNLVYTRGTGGMYPTNYYTFTQDGKDMFTMEFIPAGRYMKTIYIMQGTPDNIRPIYERIEDLYIEQREGKGVEWCIDYQNERRGIMF